MNRIGAGASTTRGLWVAAAVLIPADILCVAPHGTRALIDHAIGAGTLDMLGTVRRSAVPTVGNLGADHTPPAGLREGLLPVRVFRVLHLIIAPLCQAVIIP